MSLSAVIVNLAPYPLPMSNSTRLLRALAFAAEKHCHQRRKDAAASPYINHPIAVASLLASVGEVQDDDILMAAVLHDTLEDTLTTVAELQTEFGGEVCAWVQAVSDDKTLPKEVRKQAQIDHAPHLPHAAKLIKLADKICNVQDVNAHPPADWSLARRLDYLTWAEAVVEGCRGTNLALEAQFDRCLAQARQHLTTA